MRRGLVFGKFMPLHHGHRLLIDTALSQCDDLTIVVYDSDPGGPGVERMPMNVRLGWFRELYPEVESIVPARDIQAGNPEQNDPRHAPEYAADLAYLGRFDRVFTSEPAYERFVDLLGAKHVVVDAARARVPIAGTTIRADLYANRGWMDPRVYSTLVRKVVLVGTESTGKSSLARRLAEEGQTLWTHEFGRELWDAQGLQGTFADHLKIATKQLEREHAALRHARDFLFCDTNPWTTLHWSLLSYGTADARLIELAERTMGDYIWVLCADDFDWVQDGTRELADGRARAFQQQQEDDLRRRGVEYIVAKGTLDERAELVWEALRSLGWGASRPRRLVHDAHRP
jgi:NadR type nicotinamide-nucleotide adenylyltransferase